jgi:hypothetical protein
MVLRRKLMRRKLMRRKLWLKAAAASEKAAKDEADKADEEEETDTDDDEEDQFDARIAAAEKIAAEAVKALEDARKSRESTRITASAKKASKILKKKAAADEDAEDVPAWLNQANEQEDNVPEDVQLPEGCGNGGAPADTPLVPIISLQLATSFVPPHMQSFAQPQPKKPQPSTPLIPIISRSPLYESNLMGLCRKVSKH